MCDMIVVGDRFFPFLHRLPRSTPVGVRVEVVGHLLQDLSEVSNRPLKCPFRMKRQTTLVVRLCICRTKANPFAQVLNCLIPFRPVVMKETTVHMRICISGIETNRFGKIGESLFSILLFDENASPIGIVVRSVWIEFKGFINICQRQRMFFSG